MLNTKVLQSFIAFNPHAFTDLTQVLLQESRKSKSIKPREQRNPFKSLLVSPKSNVYNGLRSSRSLISHLKGKNLLRSTEQTAALPLRPSRSVQTLTPFQKLERERSYQLLLTRLKRNQSAKPLNLQISHLSCVDTVAGSAIQSVRRTSKITVHLPQEPDLN